MSYAEWKAARWERLGLPITPAERERWEQRRLQALAPFSQITPDAEYLVAAREVLDAAFPGPPKLGTPAGDKPTWRLVHHRAMVPAQLARVIAGMGFDRITPELPRGGVPGFEPAYFRAGFAGLSREDAARMNRALAEAPCRFVMRGTPSTLTVYLDMIDGEWRDSRGGAVGEDLISLGAYAWTSSYGRAAYRISRLTGYGELPRVGDLARR